MARIRTVKPKFFQHEELQELEAQNLGKYPMFFFEGLWCQCDKNGVFEWRPKTLKLNILPFLNFTAEDTLQILLDSGFIYKSTINGRDYGFIPTFKKHQRINGKEAIEPSVYPFIPEWAELEKQSVSNGEALEITGKEGKGKEGNRKGIEGGEPALNPEVKLFIDFAFQKFQETFGEKLLIDGRKDGAIVKSLLRTYGLERLKGLWQAFMREDGDEWLNKAGRSIGVFKTQINKLISKKSGVSVNGGRNQNAALDRLKKLEAEGGFTPDEICQQ